MNHTLKIIQVAGAEIDQYFNDLANLRITLFREFPYLYDGNLEYEKKYLKTLESSSSRVMLLLDDEKVVGVTTSLPLKNELVEIQERFLQLDFNVNEYYYLAESLLLHEYRGQGIYRKFFDFRELAAKEQGYKKTLFLSVVRPVDHPLRPKDYQPLDPIWQHFGYHSIPNQYLYYPWKEIDESVETPKPLSIWVKEV